METLHELNCMPEGFSALIDAQPRNVKWILLREDGESNLLVLHFIRHGPKDDLGIVVGEPIGVVVNDPLYLGGAEAQHIMHLGLEVVCQRGLEEVRRREPPCVQIDLRPVTDVRYGHGELVIRLLEELTKPGPVCKVALASLLHARPRRAGSYRGSAPSGDHPNRISLTFTSSADHVDLSRESNRKS